MVRERARIILVDDNKANLTFGRNLLKLYYEVYPASSADKMFEILEKATPDLILLDVEMPGMNGFEAIGKLKGDPRFADIPVIFLTVKADENSEMEGFDLGAVEYISKPFSAPLLLKRISNQLLISAQRKELLISQAEMKSYTENLEAMVRGKTVKVNRLQNAVMATVADLLEFRDKRTGGHINRTQMYLQALIEEVFREGAYSKETEKWDLDLFLTSAQLHDVGKIAISDKILNKPGKLTPEEYEIMKTHVQNGVDIIEMIMDETDEHALLQHALLIVGTHHEKWDGTGYPVGLKGANIPIEGRLMAIADVYDALISDRPYKPSFSHDEACEIIEAGAGTDFDPLLIEIFKKVKDSFEEITDETYGNDWRQPLQHPDYTVKLKLLEKAG